MLLVKRFLVLTVRVATLLVDIVITTIEVIILDTRRTFNGWKRSEADLKTNINTDAADNNARNISASDVRNNMFDIVDSIVPIVQSGINDSNFNPLHVTLKLAMAVRDVVF